MGQYVDWSDHDLLGETSFGEFLCSVLDVLRFVVRALGSTSQDDVNIGVTLFSVISDRDRHTTSESLLGTHRGLDDTA